MTLRSSSARGRAIALVATLSLSPITAVGQVASDAAAPARGGPFPWQLTVYDRQGAIVRTLGTPGVENHPPAFSPDGMRLAVVQSIPDAPGTDISIFDLSTGAGTRLMTGPAPRNPVWSPDGSRIAYFASRPSYGGLYQTPSDGSGREELLYRFPAGISDVHLTDWSPDGRFLVFDVSAVVWMLPLDDRKAVELIREDFEVFGARLSPDSRFLAYVSDQSGREEIVARAFDTSTRRFSSAVRQVSDEGGLGMVHWRADGGELYYLAPDDGVMAVAVTPASTFTIGAPRRLFQAPGTLRLEGKPDDDRYGRVSRDGQRVALQVLMPPERTVVALSPDTLARYTGTYVNPGGNSSVVVTLEGQQLLAATGPRCATCQSEKRPLFAVSEKDFFDRQPDADADIEFVRDGTGAVTRFVVYAGGTGTTWTRTDAPSTFRGGPFPRQFAVYDQQGTVMVTVGEPGHYTQPVLSPDGTRLAVVILADPNRGPARSTDPDAGLTFLNSQGSRLLVFDLSTGVSAEVATGPDLGTPVWSPDASQIAYYSNSRRGYRGLYRTASNGRERDQLLYRFTPVHSSMYLTDWSADGRFLVFNTGAVPYVLPLTGPRNPVELLREEFRVSGARVSPDGHFLAYMSGESGRNEVYVGAFDLASGRFTPEHGRWRVSDQGALDIIQWRDDGQELLFVAADGRVMAVDVALSPVFTPEPPRLLLLLPSSIPLAANSAYISRDGRHVVAAVPSPPERAVVTVAPEILAQYIGRYAGGADATPGDAVLTLERGQLMYQCCFENQPPSGTPKFPMFAESETRFFRRGPSGDADHEFVRDTSGAVTHYVLHQGGADVIVRTRK